MTTGKTVRGYFDSLKQKKSWDSLLAADVVFDIRVSQPKQLRGKSAYLESTKSFYAMIVNLDVLAILVDGERACALTRYELRPPNGGQTFQSDVAEVFTVKDGTITEFSIYFDPTPYPR